jgi:ubiquinone/menaquinone biosynthesis C-methylase UbiE
VDNYSSSEILNEFIGHINEPGLLSYTRCYYYWKKFKNISQLFKKEIKKNDSKVKVLDVGCGLGRLIYDMGAEYGADNDLEFYGVDINPLRIKICDIKKQKYKNVNANFSVGLITELDFPENTFDVLFCIEVMEHLKDYDKAAQEMYRVLKPGGIAIVTTPNRTNVLSLIKSVFKKEKNEAEDLNIEMTKEKFGYGHISVKGYKEWIKVFKEAGFKSYATKRGSLLWGNFRQDKRRFLFAFIILAEIILDKFGLCKNLTEDIVLCFRK